MNSDKITNELADALRSAGFSIDTIHHLSSMRVEFTTWPPLIWRSDDFDKATLAVMKSKVCGELINDRFVVSHGRSYDYWRFELVDPVPALKETMT